MHRIELLIRKSTLSSQCNGHALFTLAHSLILSLSYPFPFCHHLPYLSPAFILLSLYASTVSCFCLSLQASCTSMAFLCCGNRSVSVNAYIFFPTCMAIRCNIGSGYETARTLECLAVSHNQTNTYNCLLTCDEQCSTCSSTCR